MKYEAEIEFTRLIPAPLPETFYIKDGGAWQIKEVSIEELREIYVVVEQE